MRRLTLTVAALTAAIVLTLGPPAPAGNIPDLMSRPFKTAAGFTLADRTGKVWIHRDPAHLTKWVESVNARLAAPLPGAVGTDGEYNGGLILDHKLPAESAVGNGPAGNALAREVLRHTDPPLTGQAKDGDRCPREPELPAPPVAGQGRRRGHGDRALRRRGPDRTGLLPASDRPRDCPGRHPGPAPQPKGPDAVSAYVSYLLLGVLSIVFLAVVAALLVALAARLLGGGKPRPGILAPAESDADLAFIARHEARAQAKRRKALAAEIEDYTVARLTPIDSTLPTKPTPHPAAAPPPNV